MASAVVRPAARAEWAPANPWLWMLLGLAATTGACLVALAPASEWKAYRFPALFLGLLTSGTAVWMRCVSTQPSFVEGWTDARRPLVLAAVAGLGAVMVIAPTALL